MKICEPTQATSVTSFTNVLSIEYELRGESNEQDVILQWSTLKENMQNKKPAGNCELFLIVSCIDLALKKLVLNKKRNKDKGRKYMNNK